MLPIDVQALGEDHPDTAIDYVNLADLYLSLERYSEAEPLYLQALTVFSQRLGENHPNTQTTRKNFVGFLQAVVAANQTHLLSNHPITQALLAQLQP
jgi:tetratricopeptide (TPR) repeat protein